jgi:hypothetical protein
MVTRLPVRSQISKDGLHATQINLKQRRSHLLTNQSPDLVEVDHRTVVLVLVEMEVPHTDLIVPVTIGCLKPAPAHWLVKEVDNLMRKTEMAVTSHLSEVARMPLVE